MHQSKTSIYLSNNISALIDRRLNNHGFPEIIDGNYRPDATAWVLLCLDTYQVHTEIASDTRAKLCATQKTDGRIPISDNHPEAFWPTLPCALALAEHRDSKNAHSRAVRFILDAVGQRIVNDTDSATDHDSLIPGWPWIDQTYAWIEPTAIAVKALVKSGLADHERSRNGIRLLLDRQLPSGGWNYGNTTSFGKPLNPMVVPTGKALWALAGQVERDEVENSLNYLKSKLASQRTPLSLGWAIKGLVAWDFPFNNGRDLALACLSRQERYGTYNTSHLAILLMAMANFGSQETAHV